MKNKKALLAGLLEGAIQPEELKRLLNPWGLIGITVNLYEDGEEPRPQDEVFTPGRLAPYLTYEEFKREATRTANAQLVILRISDMKSDKER